MSLSDDQRAAIVAPWPASSKSRLKWAPASRAARRPAACCCGVDAWPRHPALQAAVAASGA